MIKITNLRTGKELPVTFFTFPDGQPHVTIEKGDVVGTDTVQVLARIRNPGEWINTLLCLEVIDRWITVPISLDILYLMGGRMDRPIDERQPATLSVVTEPLSGYACDGHRLRILDPHSSASTESLMAEAVLPKKAVDFVLGWYEDFVGSSNLAVVIPDKGATKRVTTLVEETNHDLPLVQCLKHRDSQSGSLSAFEVLHHQAVAGKQCIIIDDICDGGGTFTGLAAELRKHGAKAVYLYVTHGIFSKGLPIAGIDSLWTTTSYYSEYMNTKLPDYLGLFDAEEEFRKPS